MDDDFDYIVVGAGSAGCILADKLSHDGTQRVLVPEAGGSDARFWIKTPVGYGHSFYNARVNWRFYSEPEPGLDGRRAYLPRGKVLGGSSSINAMVYCRGVPADYDDWGALNPGWDWQAAAAAYAAMECRIADDGTRDGPGPVHVEERTSQYHPLWRDFVEGAEQAGLVIIPDLNAEPFEGVAPYRITTRGGFRWSSADAFLRPALKRRNVVLRTGVLVDRVQLDGHRATGLWYLRDGARRLVTARREVVLCAGAVGSPAILLRSGIGPHDDLRAHGIAVARDLAGVGRHVQDHLGIDYLYRATRPTLNQQLGTRLGQLAAGLQFLALRKGPLSISVNQIGGLVRSDEGQCRPDIQLYFNPLSYSVETVGKRRLTRPDRWPGFIIGFNPTRPTSVGTVTLRSADPADAPRIQPNYLSTAADCAAVIAGARLCARISQTPAFASLIDGVTGFDLVGASDTALLADFRQRSGTVHHLCGSCRMAPKDHAGVVDARLRVHGIAGLRVVDASIFPNVTSANTNAPVMMTAWRAAQMINADRQERR